MGSPANSSSLITSKCNPWPLSLSACSQPSLLRLMPSPRLMLMPTMATTAMVSATTAMATVPMAIPITVDSTTARGPLMLRLPPLLRLLPLLRLMLMLSMATTDTPMPMDIMVLATTDMPTPMPMATTTARGLLMLRLPPLLRLMLMLTTATTPTPMPMDIITDTDMPTVDTTATPTDMPTTDKM